MRNTVLSLSMLLVASAWAQDDCASAIPITAGLHSVSGVDGVPSTLSCAGSQLAAHGEWYTYTPTQDFSLTITTDLPQNVGDDTRFHVYTGGCGLLLCRAGDDDSGTSNLSIATFNVAAGTTYYIVFDDRWSASGFDFNMIEGEPVAVHASFTMAPATTAGFYNSCVVDMNGDLLDDIVSPLDNTFRINQQLSTGGFSVLDVVTQATDHVPSWSICAGDLDRNGLNDICYAGGGGVSFLMANEDGSYYSSISQPNDIFCQRSNMVDINNDGELDVFVCHDVAPNVYFFNNGDGTYTSHQGGLGDTPDGGNYGSIWIDYDNDGDQDMFIAKCRGGTSPASVDQLHRNNGDGTFTDVAPDLGLADFQQSWSAAWGDYDNDADLDIMIGASSFTGGGHKLMRNNGDGTFTNVTAGSGFDLFTGINIEHVTHDFDNDGYLDVFGGNNTIMFNRGDMTFEPNVIQAGHGPIGDLNNDGYLDLVSNGQLYLNDGGDNHYVKVNTIGTVSNVNGIGARITITSAMGTQIREVRSGDGFEFMSSLTAHFGLGADTEVDQITVRWPSGIVDVLYDVPANSTQNIVEGSTSTAVEEALSAELALYPVPADRMLNIRSSQDLGNAAVAVTDINGKLVLRTVLRNGQFDVSSLTPGVYMLQLSSKGHLLKRRFTKL